MTALEQVMQMKKQGRSEGEIIAALKSQGVPPMQISEAMNQSKIKEAVYDSNPTEGMTPSIMQSTEDESPQNNQEQSPQGPSQDYYSPTPSNTQNNTTQTYTPQTPQSYTPQYPQTQDPYQQGYSQQYPPQYAQQDYSQNYYPEEYAQQPTENQEYYADQNYYGSQSTDTIIEVAEQVFSEKVKKISEDLKKLNEFKTIFETKVENLKNRLERMERYFDKMQLEILNKVGEYGKGLDYMKKELKMVEDSMSKFSEKK